MQDTTLYENDEKLTKIWKLKNTEDEMEISKTN